MRHLSTGLGGRLGIIGFATLLAAQLSVAVAGEICIRNGDSIAFLGDSNTQAGWEHPYGYVRLVLLALEQEGSKATPIPAGVAGDTSERMLKRLDGVLARKPTWMTLSCGFNDVSPACSWQVGFEDFTKHVTAILDKSQAAGVKVIILTPTLYKDTDPDNETNRKAAPYVEFLCQTAKERNLPLADLNAAHRAEIARLKSENSPRKTLLRDGIHMDPQGDLMMAAVVLKTLGLTDEQIAAAASSRTRRGAAWRSGSMTNSTGPAAAPAARCAEYASSIRGHPFHPRLTNAFMSRPGDRAPRGRTQPRISRIHADRSPERSGALAAKATG